MPRSPRLWRRWPFGVALVVLGVAAIAVSTLVDPEPVPRVSGGDAPVNRGARSEGDIRANNSPTVVRNPRDPDNLAVANRIDGPRFGCALNVSADGGRRWSPVEIEIPEGEEPKCFAPDLAFTADGKLHMSYVTLKGLGNVPSAGWYVTSDDGGRTLSEPRRVLGPLSFHVRLAADPNDPRRLFLSFVRADSDVGVLRFTAPGNPALVARSTDGGSTWERPVRVNDPARTRVVAPSVAVGPEGEVYALYLDLVDDTLDYEGGHGGRGGRPYAGPWKLVLSRSLDGGVTWAESVVEDRLVPTERFVSLLPPFPSLAVDPDDGRVYVAFQDGRQGDADVMLWSRPAGGSAWSGPLRVNDTPARDGSSQYLPKLGVAPDGRLDVVYYDRRADPKDLRNEVTLQSSFDDGESFGEGIGLAGQPFDSRVGYGNERELADLGSRIGIASGEESALAVWSDTRSGTIDSNKQDIGSARVVFEGPVAREVLRALLLYGGAAAALAGPFVVVGLLFRRSRRTPGGAA